jgi:two-component system torCAD operon response regulator TorR
VTCPYHITIVEDDELLRRSLVNLFGNQGYIVSDFSSADGVYEFIKKGNTDLIVCDIVLPTLNGFELFESLSEFTRLGKIFISGKVDIEHRIKGLSLGADDYICKPLDSTELLLRTGTLLKRLKTSTLQPIEATSNIQFLELTLNIESRILSKQGVQIELGTVEHELLLLLIAHQGKVCGREKIAFTLGDTEKYINGRALDNLINRIRKKLSLIGGKRKFIITFRGNGFMLSEN